MRHVGGEALDGVHPLGQRLGHVLQRAGQVAELVVALGEVGQGDGPGARPGAPGRRPRASRSTGWAISWVSSSDESRVTADGDQDEGDQRRALARR